MSDRAPSQDSGGSGVGRDLAHVAPRDDQMQPMRAVLDRAVQMFGSRPALRFMGRVTTYGELHTRVLEAAGALRRLGAGPGVRIGILLPNCPAIAFYVLAAFEVGATVVPLDPAASDRDLAEMAAACGLGLLVTCDTAAVLGKAVLLSKRCGTIPVVVVSYAGMLPITVAAKMRLFSADTFARLPSGGDDLVYSERDLLRDKSAEAVRTGGATPRPAVLDDIAMVVFGRSGGVGRVASLTQAQIADNLVQVRDALPPLRAGQERILAAVPLWHPLAYGLALTVALAGAAELIVTPDVTGKALVDGLRQALPTVVVAAAPLLGDMLADDTLGPAQYAALRFCLSAGGTVTPTMGAMLAARSSAPLLDSYGLTTAPVVIGITGADDAGLSANTRALAGTRIVVRDFADLSREVPRGERGEICVSGPQVASTLQIAPNTGAFIGLDVRTGDLGTVDADGRLFVVDRVEDLIVAAGYLIYPRRIEAALLEFPGVIDAAVIGVDDGRRGTAPKAFVVVKRGLAVTERDLRVFLAGRISKIEMPADIDFRTALPRTAFGLICKASLRAQEGARQG